MGTGTSRIGSDPPPTRGSRMHRASTRTRARLSSRLFCGCSSSQLRCREMEDSVDGRASSSKDCNHVNDFIQRPFEENISERSRATASSSSNAETGASSESNDVTSEYVVVSHGLGTAEMNKEEACLLKSEESRLPNRMDVEIDHHGCFMDTSGSIASTSFREEQSPDLVNAVVNKEPNNGFENSVNERSSLSCICPSRTQELSHVSANELSDENHLGELRFRQDSNLSIDPERLHLVGEASVSSDVGLVAYGREQNGGNESLPRVDSASASSNFSSITNNDSSNLESRSNRRRLFFDTISSNSSESLIEHPNRDYSNGNSDNRSSQNMRLPDSSGNFSGGVRVNNQNERRRHSRSEIWDMLFGSINENQQQNSLCPSGVHPVGSCSCDSFLTGEESSIHLSISRIVMLAEALFEVLDEIQPRPASFSLPLASLAAPEAVVDSFPLREHSKSDTAESTEDVQQCYICLLEYEEGDKIRVLPCQHEYHMACVDKWLKEIHGVCPLCRGDVAQGVSVTEGSNRTNPYS